MEESPQALGQGIRVGFRVDEDDELAARHQLVYAARQP
jgi:hypothetical protein